MLKVMQYIKPYMGMLICAIALLFLQAMCDLALPDYMSDIVNKGVMNSDTAYIGHAGLKMLGVTFLGVSASIAMGYFAAMIAANVSRDMRIDVFKKVQYFSNAEMDKFATSSLITRTTNDITQIQTLLVMSIRMVFYAPIMGIGGVLKAQSKSVSMTWIIALAVIILIGFISVMFSIVMPKFKLVQNLIDRLNLVIRENLEGILVIRAFNTQAFELKRFDRANQDLTDTNLFVNRTMSVLMPFIMLVMNLTTVTIVWVGAKHISNLQMDIGSMMAFMQYGLQIIMSFLMLSMMFIMIPRAAVSANRIQEVLDTKETILDPEEPAHFGKDFVPTIEFRDVCFRYPEGEDDVLHNISFTAEAKKTTAIIGATGSGKSTLVNLIVRFYDVTSGQILIDGKDVRSVKRQELRNKIGYVSQKSILFSGTIDTNLRYSDKGVSQGTVEKAAQIAQAVEFISSKEDGYDTPIAQGGTNVSGGQKQRLSIARALVKNAPIYIFDDSFSALDLKTDSRLRAALKAETGDSTILLIAQRISTIMDAEQIIVLDKGKIVGIGNHHDLLENCSVYKEIAISQLSEEELAR